MSYSSVGAVLDGGIVTEIPSVSVEKKVNGRKHKFGKYLFDAS